MSLLEANQTLMEVENRLLRTIIEDDDRLVTDFERGESVSFKGMWAVMVFPKGSQAPWKLEDAKPFMPRYNDSASFVEYSGIPEFPYILNSQWGLIAAMPSAVKHLFPKPLAMDKAESAKIISDAKQVIADGLKIDLASVRPDKEALMMGKAGGRVGSYHYFAVVRTVEGRSYLGTKSEYAAVSVYGKMGGTPKFVKIGTASEYYKAEDLASKKMKTKLDDYQKVKLDGYNKDIAVYANGQMF